MGTILITIFIVRTMVAIIHVSMLRLFLQPLLSLQLLHKSLQICFAAVVIALVAVVTIGTIITVLVIVADIISVWIIADTLSLLLPTIAGVLQNAVAIIDILLHRNCCHHSCHYYPCCCNQ